MSERPFNQDLYGERIAVCRWDMARAPIDWVRWRLGDQQDLLDYWRSEITRTAPAKPPPHLPRNHDMCLAWRNAAQERLAVVEVEQTLTAAGVRIEVEAPVVAVARVVEMTRSSSV